MFDMEFGEVQGHLNTGVVDTIGTEALVPCACVQWVPGPVVHRQQSGRRVSAGDACRLVAGQVPRWWAFPKVASVSLVDRKMCIYTLQAVKKITDGSFLFITADSSVFLVCHQLYSSSKCSYFLDIPGWTILMKNLKKLVGEARENGLKYI